MVCSFQTLWATPRVPSSMSLADIKLKLTATGRKRIQEKVDSLTRSEKYFQVLLDRVNLFFPIVERVLQEEGISQDFRYQIIQESAMVSDAVHTSNTVGFWQFKDFTAAEVGLQINGHVDERMHITTATRGAARYLRSHNQHLDNWLYSMLAYNQGRGYVERNTNWKKYKGAKRMRIDGKTHWYIIHFLAHKVVFESKAGEERHPELYLHEYEEAHGKTLGELAQAFGVEKEQLKEHNKWLKRHRVPHDTTCAMIIPMTHEQYAQHKSPKPKQVVAKLDKAAVQTVNYTKHKERAADFPIITAKKDEKTGLELTVINGIMGRVAQDGDKLETLAKAGEISIKNLLSINDLDQAHQVVSGQVYYFKTKKNRAKAHYHIAKPGETWWHVAQRYGIKKRKLLLKNRLRKEVALQPWRILWLRFIRPAKIPVAYNYPVEEEKKEDTVETTTPTPDQEETSNPAPLAPTMLDDEELDSAPIAYEAQDIFEPDN